MKMRPDFSFGPTEDGSGNVLNNVSPGKQSAGTNGGNDQRTENGQFSGGHFPYLVYQGFDSDSIPQGTRIRLTMTFTRQGRGDAACETRTLDLTIRGWPTRTTLTSWLGSTETLMLLLLSRPHRACLATLPPPHRQIRLSPQTQVAQPTSGSRETCLSIRCSLTPLAQTLDL